MNKDQVIFSLLPPKEVFCYDSNLKLILENFENPKADRLHIAKANMVLDYLYPDWHKKSDQPHPPFMIYQCKIFLQRPPSEKIVSILRNGEKCSMEASFAYFHYNDEPSLRIWERSRNTSDYSYTDVGKAFGIHYLHYFLKEILNKVSHLYPRDVKALNKLQIYLEKQVGVGITKIMGVEGNRIEPFFETINALECAMRECEPNKELSASTSSTSSPGGK